MFLKKGNKGCTGTDDQKILLILIKLKIPMMICPKNL